MNYIVIDGNKVELSEETVENIKNSLKEKTYKIGDKFHLIKGSAEVMITNLGCNNIALINVGSYNLGYRWAGNTITVENVKKITVKELTQITNINLDWE